MLDFYVKTNIVQDKRKKFRIMTYLTKFSTLWVCHCNPKLPISSRFKFPTMDICFTSGRFDYGTKSTTVAKVASDSFILQNIYSDKKFRLFS